MIKQILYILAKRALFWGLNYVYDYIDKDDDGKISKEELGILHEQLKEVLDRIKNRRKCLF